MPRRTQLAPSLLLALLAAAPVAAQECPAPPREAGGQPAAAVRYLAADALQGRVAGSPGERCAAEYIAREFRRIGLKPGGAGDSYFQEVPLATALNPHAPAGTGRNVIGILEGSDRRLRAEAVVVGAHYDHLGLGGMFSLSPDEKAVHNGADDNASGVGALLAVAEALSRGERPARSVVFVAFTGEEFGLLGSAHYAQNPAFPLASTRAMLNMDMVGRLGAGPMIVYGTGTASEWDTILAEANRRDPVPIRGQTDGYGASDHTSFYSRDVPVLHFFTNVHSDYHRPSDDPEKIDYPGLERVSALVARVTRAVAARPATLTLQRGAGEPPRRAEGSGYGAYLGTVPDFAPVERGVKLSGVRQGSPAEAAGLRAGDVIVAFDAEPIADLQGLTDALRSRKSGQEVAITVLRGGREVTVKAVLGSR